jgi:hypothetical protein
MRARLGKARQPVATRQCPRNREQDLDYPAQSEGPDCLGSRVDSTGLHGLQCWLRRGQQYRNAVGVAISG